MLKVGLTGGIGSGKSTVARRLTELGALVVDADAISREVLGAGTPGLKAVVDRFGPDIVRPDGTHDRAALAQRVFGNDDHRIALERIVHPLVQERVAAQIAGAPPEQVVVYDVPLLVEKHLGGEYHLVVVVDADSETRLRRLVGARGMNETDARRRMEHQASDEQRRAAADVILSNTGTIDELEAKVDELWENRLKPYNDNLLHGRRHRRTGPPHLVPYDPRWPEAAERIAERICARLGDRVPEIEHVGSTSVPGLPARDVLDLQLGVRSLKDADDPEFVRALTELGFPRSEGNSLDTPKDLLPDPSLWIKRYHGSSDPGRIAHLHIRELGSAGWQYALLQRDWLRSDPGAREDYLAEKERLSASVESADAYREAKEPWFNRVWPRMQSWAQRSGWHD